MDFQIILKSIINAFNFKCAILGLSLMVLGCTMLYHSDERFISRYSYVLAIIINVVGAVMILICLFGIFGSCLENRCLLFTYCTLLIFLVIVEFLSGLAIFAFYNRERVSKVMESSLEYYDEDKFVRKFWDLVNSNLECCGINSLEDWGDHLPNSCCKDLNINDVCHKEQAYDRPCLTELEKCFKRKMPISLSIIGSLELLAFLFAYCLCRLARRNR